MSEAQIVFFGMTMDPSRSVKLFGISFYWSGLLIAAGFLAAVIYTLWRCKKFGLKDDNVTDALILAVPAAIIGARLFHVIGHLPTYIADPAGIIRIWDGGLSMFGGIVFALVAAWLYCRKKKISLYATLDAAGPGVLLGTAIAAWGDFFDRTGYGNLTNLPWKLGLTISGETFYVQPLFLYAFLLLAAGFVLLHIWSVKKERAYDGELFLLFLVWFSFVKMILLPAQYGQMIYFQPGRFLAAIIFCVAVILLVHNKRHVKHRPEMLFANGGEAFPSLKQTKKGRYGTYYDDEINDETDVLAVGATYDRPEVSAKADAGEESDEEEADEEEEDEDEGFEPFGLSAGEEDK